MSDSVAVFDSFISACIGVPRQGALPSGCAIIQTLGFSNPGDGGGAFYTKCADPDQVAIDYGGKYGGTNWSFRDPEANLWVLTPLDGTLNVAQFGVDGGITTDSAYFETWAALNTFCLQSALDFGIVFGTSGGTFPPNRRPRLLIPPGNYFHNGVVIRDVQVADGTGPSSGYIEVEGAGIGSTLLICNDPDACSLTILSGCCTLRSMWITSNTAVRGQSTGSTAGHGILVSQVGGPLSRRARTSPGWSSRI